MNIFDEANFKVFEDALKSIYIEYDNIISVFGSDIHDYILKTETPYSISIPLQDVLTMVDNNYIDICTQVTKVFSSSNNLNDIIDNFTKYFGLMSDCYESTERDTDTLTKKMAVVLILISRNVNTPVLKKIQAILKSMCVQPTVGLLVSVSADVLESM